MIDLWSVSRICFLTLPSIAFVCFSSASLIVVICFWKAFPEGEWVNLGCSIIWLWSPVRYCNVSSPVRYSYLSNLPDDNADIAVSLLIFYCNFSSVILSSIVITIFYILSKRCLKHKGLSDARVLWISEREYDFAVLFWQRIK